MLYSIKYKIYNRKTRRRTARRSGGVRAPTQGDTRDEPGGHPERAQDES